MSCNFVDECVDEAVHVHFDVDLNVGGEASVSLGISTDLNDVATLKLVIFGVGNDEAADEAFDRSEVKDLWFSSGFEKTGGMAATLSLKLEPASRPQ